MIQLLQNINQNVKDVCNNRDIKCSDLIHYKRFNNLVNGQHFSV